MFVCDFSVEKFNKECVVRKLLFSYYFSVCSSLGSHCNFVTTVISRFVSRGNVWKGIPKLVLSMGTVFPYLVWLWDAQHHSHICSTRRSFYSKLDGL